MSNRGTMKWLWACMAMVLVLPAMGINPARAAATSRLFPETGKIVQGKFLDYWNIHGALAQQGFPISNEMQEKSQTDGKTYTIQYFERAVFEMHPENKAPNDILLSLLGNFLYAQKYPHGAPAQLPNRTTGSVLVSQTGKRMGGKFLAYWNAHGGLAQQGYPISDEFMEKSDLDGKTYKVQYFERAVFEYHPENAGTQYEVLLSQLGKFRYAAKYGNVSGGGSTQPKGSGKSAVQLVSIAKSDINSYWQNVFSNAGAQYIGPKEVVGYTKAINTACGPAIPNNAFYCPPSHSIYYDVNFLQAEANTFGDFAPQLIIAHEWGHLVQRNVGLLSDTYFSVEIELQADCFAGAWAKHASATGLLGEGNLDEGAAALFEAGNTDVPWFDPGAHGTSEQRVNSFVDGFIGGPDACIK